MSVRHNIFGKTLDELRNIAQAAGLPGYTALQIADWLYKKNATTFSEMSNISLAARNKLEKEFVIGIHPPVKKQVSSDGTIKYLFQINQSGNIESVFIPEQKRSTLCISTQIGCKMACRFCMTGRQGFNGNITSGDILNQIYSVPESEKLSNYVFMGMGEPLLNFDNVLNSLEIMTSSYGMNISPSRITVSTIGVIPQLEYLLKESRCHIAVSLHSPFSTERQELMPVEKAFPIENIVELLRKNSNNRQRRFSFEYLLIKGVNDTSRHVNGISKLLNGLRCRINLIRYHPIPGVEYESSDETTVRWFKNRLESKGFITTIRASRGQDIFAACGMLSSQSI